MVALFILHLACTLHGIDGRECVAVGYVESGYSWQAKDSAVGCVGLMQVDPRYSTLPAWALRTLPGSALAGAKALAYWHKHRPLAPFRGYACGHRDGSKACWKYQRAVENALGRWR